MFNKINFPPYKGGAGRVLLALVLLLSSCSLYRKYGDTPEVPSNVMGDVSNQGDTASLGAVSWRQLFTDPQLQDLIEKAWTNNTDVKAAQLSIEQAQNDLTVARLGYLPTLSFEPSGTLNRFNGVGVHSYVIPVKQTGDYRIILTTDDKAFGGFGNIDTSVKFPSEKKGDNITMKVYNVSRVATVYQRV